MTFTVTVELGEHLEFELIGGGKRRLQLVGGSPPLWQDFSVPDMPKGELNDMLGQPWVVIRRLGLDRF